MRFLINSSLDNTLLVPGRIISYNLLASSADDENDPDSDSDDSEFDLGVPNSEDDSDDSEDDSDDSNDDGFSDKSSDSQETLDIKEKIRQKTVELNKLKEEKEKINDKHSTTQDQSDHEQEEIELNKLVSKDNEIENKRDEILGLKGELKSPGDNKKRERDSDDEGDENLNSRKKRKRDSDDEGDNNRRGGPSAGTTGGSSEGGPSVGGSSGGVEGSSASKVKSESPLDFVLEKESLELPSFLDDIE